MATIGSVEARIFFGWRVVAVAFVFAVFSWGIAFYGPAFFLHALHAARGWPIALISAAVASHFLAGALFVAHLDDAHRRFGMVATTRGGVVALAAGALAWSLAGTPWQLFAASILTGAGWAATSSAAINAMLLPWFKRRRGFAISLALNGASLGGAIFIPLWLVLVELIGFAAAAAAIGSAAVFVLWPLAGTFLGRTPAEMGLNPDGGARAVDLAAATLRSPVSRTELLHQRRFLTLSSAFALGLFSQAGLISHLLTLLVPTLGEGGAAGAISLSTTCAVVGRLLLGVLIDRIDRRLAAAGNFALQAGGFLLLLLGAGSVTTLLGCVLFGLGFGNLTSLPPLIADVEFEPVDLGRVVGLVIAINQAVFSFAPAVFGALHDLADSYRAPLFAAVALHATAIVLVLAGRRR